MFGSTRSTIFFSAGDDGIIKVALCIIPNKYNITSQAWDTRTTSANALPVGMFAGHRDGITCLDSRGDDRYVVSNSKDQTIKLWDIRMFASEKAVKVSCTGTESILQACNFRKHAKQCRTPTGTTAWSDHRSNTSDERQMVTIVFDKITTAQCLPCVASIVCNTH